MFRVWASGLRVYPRPLQSKLCRSAVSLHEISLATAAYTGIFIIVGEVSFCVRWLGYMDKTLHAPSTSPFSGFQIHKAMYHSLGGLNPKP